MPIDKLRARPSTDTQPTVSPAEWKWFYFIGDVLKFNTAGGETKSTFTGDVPLKIAKLAISGVSTGLTAWQNPESGTIIIHNAILYSTTVAGQAGTIDIGTTAVSATTTSDNIFDGINAEDAVPAMYSMVDPALDTAANVAAKSLASGAWVTVDSKTGSLASYVGDLYIFYTTL